MTTRNGDWMQTYTGRQFWPLDPRPNEIFLEDIAHALSLACRYAGHCINFYSVAEHSVLMAKHFMMPGTMWFSRTAAKWALLHDASEAYLVDVPRPVKPYLTGYREAEYAVMAAIRHRFSLFGPDMPRCVKEADNRILVDERDQNMQPCDVPWDLPFKELGVTLQCLSPNEAERQFLDCANELGLTDRS